MSNEIRKYLFDIKQSIESIESFLGPNLDFKGYLRN